MRSATRVTVSTFGVLAGLAGIEHGIGEILQGNVAPDGLVIESWPGSEAFRILGGEPAMTVVPSLLVTGVLAILASLAFVVWAAAFVQRKHGGLVLIALSVLMLLVGGGFGPPILGVIVGVAATRIDGSLTWWRVHLPAGSRRVLASLWPLFYLADLVAWLTLFPGSVLLGADRLDAGLIPVLSLFAFGFLLLTTFTGFAHDAQRQTALRQPPSVGAAMSA